jgi:two-component system, cell cycle sensor histidine kinase and response regulator CckA
MAKKEKDIHKEKPKKADIKISKELKNADLHSAFIQVSDPERMFSAVFDTVPEAIAITEHDTYRMVAVNPAFIKLSGYSKDEIIGKTSVELNFWVKSDARAIMLEKLDSEGGVSNLEIQFRQKDGQIRDTLFAARLIDLSDRKYSFIYVKDITEQKQREKELNLRADLLDAAVDAIIMRDLEGKIVYANEAAYKQRGFKRSEVLDSNITQLVTPEFKQLLNEINQKTIDSGEYTFESAFHLKDGTDMPVEVHTHHVNYDGKDYVVGISRDMTQRKKADEELRLKSQLLDYAVDAIYIHDVQGNLIYVNDYYCKLLGYSREELLRMNIHNIDVPESTGKVPRRIPADGILSQVIFESEQFRKDGSIVSVEVHARDCAYNNRKYGMVICRDITERKKAEEELHLKSRLLDASVNQIGITDVAGNLIYVNESFSKNVGYSREELLKMNIHDLDVQESTGQIPTRTQTNDNLVFETEVYRKDGSKAWIEVYDSEYIYGDHTYRMAVSTDITERKKAEEQLHLRSLLLDSALDSIFIHDIEGNLIYVNENYCQTLGYTREELLKMNIHKIDVPESSAAVPPRMFGDATVGRVLFETEHRRKDGSAISMEVHASDVEYNGRKYGMSVCRDITERNKAEQELKLRSHLLDSALDSIFIHDPEGNLIYVNETFCNSLGYSRDELLKMNIHKIDYFESNGYVPQRTFEIGSNSQQYFESEHTRKDGSNVSVEVFARFLEHENNKYIISVCRDITQRKQYEEKLKKSEEQYRLLAENTGDVIWTTDPNLNFTYISPSVHAILGYEQEVAEQMPVSEMITPDSLRIIMQAYEDGQMDIKAGKEHIVRIEINMVKKDRSIVCVEAVIKAMYDGSGKHIGFAGVSRDITERKKDEEIIKRSEERYRLVAENTGDVIWTTGADLLITYVSPSVRNQLGYEPEERVGHSIIELVSLSSQQKLLEMYEGLKNALERGLDAAYRFEFDQIRKDGTIIWVEAVIKAVYDADKTLIGFTGVSRDITERKKMEDERKQNEARLESLVRIAQYQEKDSQDLLDYALEQAIGLTGSKLGYIYHYFEDKKEFVLNTWSKNVMKECTIQKPQAIYHLDKTGIWGEAIRQHKPIVLNDYQSADPLKKGYPDGHAVLYKFLTIPVITDNRIVSVVGVANKEQDYNQNDILQLTLLMDSVWKMVEHRKVVQALADSRASYYTLLENASQAVAIFQDEIFKFVNSKYLELTGYSMEEVINEHFAKFTHKDDLEHVKEDYGRRSKGEILLQRDESRIVRKDGQVIWLRLYIVKVNWEGRDALLYFHQDITEQKKAIEALQASEARFNEFFQNATNYCYMISNDGKILDINRSAIEVLGYDSKEELIGKPVETIYAPSSLYKVRRSHAELIKNRKITNEERTIISRTGEERDVMLSVSLIQSDSNNPLYAVAIQTDITDRKRLEHEQQRLEEEQQRLQKLESIGTLAGGIAHDFNNVLTAILGNVSLARMENDTGEKARAWLLQAENASLRAKDLTQQLLTFARGGAPIKKHAEIGEMIKETASFVVRGSNSKCEFNIPSDLWPVEVDEGQISQVISNLVINARQSMPAGGIIDIRAENMRVSDERSLGRSLPLPNGRYVRIIVNDHGMGIPPEHLSKIFDPYFTTKQDGSGLGLATAFSIVRRHNGHMSVESTPRVGTTFYVYLPASKDQSEPIKEREKTGDIDKAVRILLMDDEEILRNVAKNMLKRIGYENVDVVADGQQTVDNYQIAMQSGNPYDIVILDLTVPGGMGGLDALKNLLELNPDVKCIVSSGYASEAIMADYKRHGFKGVIAKPYTLEQLHSVIESVCKTYNN